MWVQITAAVYMVLLAIVPAPASAEGNAGSCIIPPTPGWEEYSEDLWQANLVREDLELYSVFLWRELFSGELVVVHGFITAEQVPYEDGDHRWVTGTYMRVGCSSDEVVFCLVDEIVDALLHGSTPNLEECGIQP